MYLVKGCQFRPEKPEKSLTKIQVCFVLIHVLNELDNLLLSMEDTCMTDRCRKTVGFGEKAFTTFQIFVSETFHICGKIMELAETIVGMPMEATNKETVIETLRLPSEWTGS